jgi:hypothetical protein
MSCSGTTSTCNAIVSLDAIGSSWCTCATPESMPNVAKSRKAQHPKSFLCITLLPANGATLRHEQATKVVLDWATNPRPLLACVRRSFRTSRTIRSQRYAAHIPRSDPPRPSHARPSRTSCVPIYKSTPIQSPRNAKKAQSLRTLDHDPGKMCLGITFSFKEENVKTLQNDISTRVDRLVGPLEQTHPLPSSLRARCRTIGRASEHRCIRQSGPDLRPKARCSTA